MNKNDFKQYEIEINKEIGKRLKSLRKSLKVTIRVAAKDLAVSNTQYCKYESGENGFSIAKLKLFCTIYDVPTAYFFKQ